MKKEPMKEDMKNLIEYCKYLEWDNLKTKDFDRGYRFGVEHIRQQIDKILDCKWSHWNINNFPEYRAKLKQNK